MRSIRAFSQDEQRLFMEALIEVLALEDCRRTQKWKKTIDCSDPQSVRQALGLSQKKFELLFGFSTALWEREERNMALHDRLLFNLIYHAPSQVIGAAIREREYPSDIPILIKTV